jgi:hypothetical protein
VAISALSGMDCNYYLTALHQVAPTCKTYHPLLCQLDHAEGLRRVPKDRHRNDGSSFQTGVSCAFGYWHPTGKLARVLHRQHSISNQP